MYKLGDIVKLTNLSERHSLPLDAKPEYTITIRRRNRFVGDTGKIIGKILSYSTGWYTMRVMVVNGTTSFKYDFPVHQNELELYLPEIEVLDTENPLTKWLES